MNKKILISIIIILVLVLSVGTYLFLKPTKPQPNMNKCGDGICQSIERLEPNLCPNDCRATEEQTSTFFMIHFEVGARKDNPTYSKIAPGSTVRNLKYQEALWPATVKLLDLANQYDFDLTLAFNPQWAEYILQDKEKVAIVKEWQKQGHEIAFHHHAYTHNDWHGFSDRTEPNVLNDPKYRGKLEEGIYFINEVAKPEEVITGSSLSIATGGGKDNPSDARKKLEIIKKWGKDVPYLSHGFFDNFIDNKLMEEFKQEYKKTENDEIFGVTTHAHNFYNRPEIMNEWFEFIKTEKDKIQTVKKITKEFYPEFVSAD
ncbi:MAG TPA: hypothetical protein ENH26_00735 [Candidatus Wolfebacteria bacterium]|nr:hypothetical protein [Candidatus Wolfebacteria bacterium]